MAYIGYKLLLLKCQGKFADLVHLGRRGAVYAFKISSTHSYILSTLFAAIKNTLWYVPATHTKG